MKLKKMLKAIRVLTNEELQELVNSSTGEKVDDEEEEEEPAMRTT
jgi:hypothetical protein